MKKLLPTLLLAMVLLSACTDSGSTTTQDHDSIPATMADSTTNPPVDSPKTAEVTPPADSASATPTTDPTKTGTTGQPDKARTGDPAPIVSNYRITVSFISIGGGIDHKAKQNLDTYVADFSKRNNVKLHYEQVGWGREGEVDYCFPLTELKEPLKGTFVKEVKLKMGENKLVQIKENTTCRKPR